MNSIHTERIGVREISLINTSETIRTKTSLSFVYVIRGKELLHMRSISSLLTSGNLLLFHNIRPTILKVPKPN